eukprot:XP_011678903.1 PREDICTED: uncharacterized protein LOC100892150 isoform X2 [Strongylocentrotus purpuratus]
MSSSRKKHILPEMKKILEQRKAELEFNEREIIQHVRYISEETMGQLKELLKETDKKKFLKAFPTVSIKMDKSLTALMMIKASLPNFESDESSTDCASDEETPEACDTPTVEDRTDDSTTEIEQSPALAPAPLVTPGTENEACESSTNNQTNSIDTTESRGSSSTLPSSSSQPSVSPNHKSNSSSVSSESVDKSKYISPPSASSGDPASLPGIATKPLEATQEKTVPSGLLPSVPKEIVPVDLPVGMRVEVVVSEVVSPSIFWIQPTQSRIEALMEEIRKYYSSVVKLPPLQPKVGMYCCACFTNDDCWYRARIIAIHLSPTSVLEGVGVHVDVIYIDYGNRERIPDSRLRPLHPRFMSDSAQAVCCKLARVKPTGKGVSHWTTDETEFFTQMTFGRKLTAIVVRQPGSSTSSFDLPAVDLLFDHYINEKETGLVDVSKLMVSKKRALPDDQCSTTDSYYSQTTHTTDSDVCQSPNVAAATDVSQSVTLTPSQEQGKDQGHEAGQQDRKESGSSSGKKKKKKKTKRSKRHHDPQLSTEDTDVPYEEGRDARQLAKEELRKESSTSDTPVYESEYTTEKRVPGLCRTPETSCTDSPAGKASLVVMTKGQTTPLGHHDDVMDGGTQEIEKDSHDQQVSCGSESARSNSPNSTSGVSSARSLTFVPQKNLSDTSRPGLITLNKPQGESNIPSSKQMNIKKGNDKPLVVETAKAHSNKTAMHIASSAENDHLTDLTDQFFTCAEDASEADSTDREVAKPKTDGQPQSSPAISKVDVIGQKYVPQRTLRDGEQILFAMSHVVSPLDFYIHLITPEAQKMDYLLDELNSVYSDIERAGVYRPPISWLSIRAVCCGKFGEDNRWYRGVVQDIKGVRGVDDGRHVLVKYVDFGNEEWIPESMLYPLENYFCSLAPLAFKCGLARIQPPMTDGTKQTSKDNKGTSAEWSEECKLSLVGMSEFEKLLTGQVIRVGGKQKECTWLEVKDNTEAEGVCLNQRLVDQGLASSSYYKKQPVHEQDAIQHEASPSDCPDPKDEPEGGQTPGTMDTTEGPSKEEEVIIDHWNPMVQHFSSETNSYGVDMDDPVVATTGMKSTIEGRVCKYYAAGRRCYKGVTCPFEHPRRGQELREQTEVFWCNTSVSLPKAGHWVALEVTAVHTSIHFWVQLPFGPKPIDQAQREWTGLNQVPEERKDDGETLTALQDSINAIYQKSYTRREDLSLLALGEIVCAQFSKDESWYRARVVDVDAEANTVQVFYVDYGNCEWLVRSKVRPAMPQFLHLPFQAVECFLGGIELIKPTSLKNQDLDRKLFEELTMDKILVGHVVSSDGDILHVELYDTISAKHVNIGDALVNAGFARHTKTPQTAERRTPRQDTTG